MHHDVESAACDETCRCCVQVKQVRDGIADIPDGVHGPRKPGRVCSSPIMPWLAIGQPADTVDA